MSRSAGLASKGRWSVSSASRPRSRTALTSSGRNPPSPVNCTPPCSARSISSSSQASSASCSRSCRPLTGLGGPQPDWSSSVTVTACSQLRRLPQARTTSTYTDHLTGPVAALDPPGDQALAAHRVRDRLLGHDPARVAQIGVQPRRTVQPPRLLERLGHGGVDLAPSLLARRRRALEPLVEPRERDPEQGAGERVRHPVEGPLVGDEAGHAHFVASFTHRTTDRLSTSRSIRSSAFSARSRLSSSMSPVDRPSVPFRASRALATQLPNVPSLTPRSRAT